MKNLNIKLFFYNLSLNKLEEIIKAQKDLLPNYSKKNVVYKISCDATYVGQTKRKLNIRISEHRNQFNRKSTNTTVITEHRLRHNHDFDWLNVKILDSKRFFGK